MVKNSAEKKKLKAIRTDNRGEFTSAEFEAYLKTLEVLDKNNFFMFIKLWGVAIAWAQLQMVGKSTILALSVCR